MDDTAILISQISQQNELGDWEETEQYKTVYVSVGGITSAEHFRAAEVGLSPQAVLTTSIHDYSGEQLLEWRDERYAIYRAYADPITETAELYIERQGGAHGSRPKD